MIQENELRVGNYLYDDTNRYFQVRQIGVGLIESCGMHIYEIEEIQPIEINEEILLKCGFKKGLKYFSYKDFDVDLTGWFGFNNMVANANIKHLHQLQNLYYALCNEELNVQL